MNTFRFATTTLALAAALFATGCANTPTTPAATGAPDARALHTHPLFDGGAKPQDDLFRAVNGKWLDQTPMPADKSYYGVFTVLRDQADARVRTIVEELAARPPANELERKLGDYYRTWLDTAVIDAAGLAPVQPWLQQIDALKTPAELVVHFGRLQGIAATPVAMFVTADAKDPLVHRLHLGQSGLGLPDRDYYLQDNPRFAKARNDYLAYLQTLLQAAGDPQSANSAQAVYALEKRLAEAQWARVDNRDPIKRYNAMSAAELAQLSALPWGATFQAAALPAQPDKLIVSQPSYLKALAQIVAETPLPVWQAYLKARVLHAGADVLPQSLREARFKYEDQSLMGLAQPEPRWQQSIKALNTAMGEAVGQLYVKKHFPLEYKARMQQLVDHLMQAYRQSIDGLVWMSPQTKLRAQDKLAKYSTKIGYPEVWRDYGPLEVRAGDAFGNRARAGRFAHEYRAKRVGQPVDRREWWMTPQTVNAYYSGTGNEIVFPAAILEPPFFDMQADDAYNYGAIGAVIGHEISHGFDDSGSRYDGDGRLNNWWTEADRKAFDALAAKLVAQYDAYEPLPGHKLNGKLTLGENIADLSGLQIAYKAYKLSLGGKPAPVVDGLTGDQRFHLGWARSWRSKMRDERLLQLLVTDPHSPGQYRANGAAVNHDAFHDAFETKPGDAMFKPADERIRIW